MKTVFATLIVLLSTLFANGECASEGLYVFPTGKTIKQNSIFIVDGYANSQEIILGLNKRYLIHLKGGDKKINLIVSTIYVGQFQLTQAILKPERELEAGLEYTMCIDKLPDNSVLQRYNTAANKYETVKYKVEFGTDTDKPTLLAKPKEIKKSLVHYGCGPSALVYFSFPVIDSSDIIIKTVLKNLETSKETTYYITPTKNEILVGHGMCSGAFTFDDGEKYEVEFSFMDASGNTTPSTERIKFTKPTKRNE